MDAFSLIEKTIFITGASSGIGRACAVAFSKAGARLILSGRNEAELEKTKLMLVTNSTVESFLSDLCSDTELENKIARKVDQLGPISGFVHCAGIEKTLPIRKHTPQIYHDIFNVNVVAGFDIARILSQKKYKAETSSFVFVSSVAGMVGEPGKLAYSASKGAVVSGVRSMAIELAKNGIRVNSVSPAMVHTPILEQMFSGIGEDAAEQILRKHPLGIGQPEDVANACLFLLSDAAKWITGTNLVVDGGYSAH